MTDLTHTQPQRIRVDGDISNLVKQLAGVMLAVDRVPKRGRNDFHGYDYATEADISEAIRKELGERGIVIFPSGTSTPIYRHLKNAQGKTKTIGDALFEFLITDGTGTVAVFMPGSGEDVGDKVSPKATTNAVKYLLLKLFLVPTGDDPEASDSQGRSTAGSRAAQRGATETDPSDVFPRGFPIGKDHKGKKLEDVPSDFLEWVLNNPDKALNPNDARWGAKNAQQRAAIQVELSRRAGNDPSLATVGASEDDDEIPF